MVGRLVARWPEGGEKLGFLLGGEVGYAGETPAAEAVALDEAGDAGGLAWNVVASLMDIRPGHSLGLNYGRTDAGWLLSPQYRENEELIEVRYRWEINSQLSIEARARSREDLDGGTTATHKRKEREALVRLTWKFD